MNRNDLRQYKYREQWIKDRMEYLEEYRQTINRIIATISDMPKGSTPVSDSMAERIANLIDYSDEVLKQIETQQIKQKELVKQLDKVSQPYQNILFKVYIQGKNLVQTANEMNYSYERIRHMHGIALNKFDDSIIQTIKN